MTNKQDASFVPSDEVAKRWRATWDNYKTVLTTPELASYFAQTSGLRMMHGHLIMPSILFGPLDQIEKNELNLALAILEETISALPPESINDTTIMSMHGCLPQILAAIDHATTLRLACMFAVLYCHFEQSSVAAFLCFERYRVCKIFLTNPNTAPRGALFIEALGAFPSSLARQLTCQTAKLTPFSLKNATWEDNYSRTEDIVISVLLNLIVGIRRNEIAVQMPIDWMPWYNSAPSKLIVGQGERAVDIFLLPIIHQTLSDKMPCYDLWQQCFPFNFCFYIGDTTVLIHDWALASVFPFFAKTLASGLGEAITKTMTLPPIFPIEVFQNIVRYGSGTVGPPCTFIMPPTSMSEAQPSNVRYDQPLEEFGIYYLNSFVVPARFVAPRTTSASSSLNTHTTSHQVVDGGGINSSTACRTVASASTPFSLASHVPSSSRASVNNPFAPPPQITLDERPTQDASSCEERQQRREGRF